ncbi:MAG TPA: UPF0280 family protein [Candidatus Avidesulfovibrio excrementigallinarum]|nr:UPF0280 family protein [Candidatus Avidesulfovibrio excrementigallinarum]
MVPLSSEIHAGIYRQLVTGGGLKRFQIRQEQSDLLISARKVLEREAREALRQARAQIIDYAAGRKDFYTSLQPLAMDEQAPKIVCDMLQAGIVANVGPMAAVAGAVAQYVGEALLAFSDEVIVENGGDVFLCTATPPTLCVVAESAGTGCIHIRPAVPGLRSFGVCTSSGKLGPSLSLGNADSVTVLSERTAVADALATRLCNLVRRREDVRNVLEYSRTTPAEGVVVIMEDCIGARGSLEIVA